MKADYDLGYFTKARPPRALFEEGYDLIIVASIAKMHNCSYYSLLIKNFSVTWNPRNVRWHIHGIPARLFDREYVSELIGEEISKDREYNVIYFKVNKRRKAIITNGRLSTSPLSAYMEEGEMLLQIDPHHLAGLSLVPLTLGMSYLVVRFTGMFASVLERLKARGIELRGIISGIVGQEGEGPLVYGARRFGGFALAGEPFPALETLALDIMTGKDEKGFREVMLEEAISFSHKYKIEEPQPLFEDANKLWTIELANKLTSQEADPYRLTVTLVDFEGLKSVEKPWDLRNGRPFIIPKAVYVSPYTWLRIMYMEHNVYFHAMDLIAKNIEVPLVPPV